MKYSLCFAASLLLLAGCQSDRPTAAQEEIIRRLDAIGTSLDQLGKTLDSNRQSLQRKIQHGMFQADPAKLAAIPPLPDKPTDEQIRSYLTAIREASIGQNSFSPENPQVAMYLKIGPGHLNLLLPEFSGPQRNHHLVYALSELVGPDDKKIALNALPLVPELLIPILKNGWAGESKKEVFSVLANGRAYYTLQDQKKAILALAEDEEGRKQLIQSFLVQPNLLFLFDDLSRLPGVNATELINQAWERQRFSSQSWSLQQLAQKAARHGNVEALGYLINLFCAKTPDDYFPDDIIMSLSLMTGMPLQADKLQSWYAENHDKLVFDPATTRYQVKK